MNNFIEVDTNKGKAKLFKGFPRAETPKTYKKIAVLSHSIGNNYNSSLLVLFKAKNKSLRYEIYKDGSIYPYYGRFKFAR